MGRRELNKSRFDRLGLHLMLMLAVVVTLVPILLAFATAFKLPRDIISGQFAFVPTFYNWRNVFREYSFARLSINSLVSASFATVIILAIASLAAFSLSKFRWPRWFVALLIGLLLLVQMLPPVVFSGPFYLMTRNMGTYDTPLALIMAYIVLQMPLAVLIMQRFFTDLPDELLEAAAMDGARSMTVFLKICLPLTTPGLATAGLLSFVFSWNDFMFALTLTSTTRGMTIPVGIANFSQDFQVLYGNIAAGAAFAALPAVLMVLFAQRYITRGLTLGAIKS